MNVPYLKLLQSIEAFASAHLEVRRFKADFLEQMGNFGTLTEAYPVLYASPSSASFNQDPLSDINTYTLTFYCVDVIQQDRGNINDILSTTAQILNDLHKYFKSSDLAGITIITDSTSSPLNNYLLDYTAGWSMTVTFQLETYTVCDIPFSESPIISVDSCDINYDFWRGPQGFQGPAGGGASGSGGTGPQGFQGNEGVQGTQGFQGNQGLQGFQGFAGTTGTGVQGPQGFQGRQGFQGIAGITGTGTQGNQGPQGFQGNQGFQGFAGTTGTQGAQGAQGFQGRQGFQGNQGNQGAIGITGSGTQGPQGFQGNQGNQGLQGTTGTGVQGFQGPAGGGGTGGGGGVYVPYVGATGDVHLSGYDLYTDTLWLYDSPNAEYGSIILDDNIFVFSNFNGDIIFSAQPGSLSVLNSNGTTSTLNFASSNYTYTFPGATGTIALTSDIENFVPYTGATNDVNLFGNDLLADNLYVGGTSGLVVTSSNIYRNAPGFDFGRYGSGGNISIYANNTTLAQTIFSTSGNIAIGTTSDTARLVVQGNSAVSGIALQVLNSTSATQFAVLNNGNIGIGLDNPTYKVEILSNNLDKAFSETPGLILTNRTGATSSTGVQYSPTLTFEGQGYLTVGSTGSKSVKFKAGVITTGNSNNALGDLDFQTSVAGDTYRSAFKITPRYSSTAGGGFTLPNNAQILWGIPFISSNGSRMTFSVRGGNFVANEYHFTFATSNDFIGITSGISGHVRYTTSFTPTSGNATFDMMTLFPTINQTGGASGASRGLYINPTLTSAADFRAIEATVGNTASHTLIKLNNGSQDIFSVKGDAKIGFFGVAPVAQQTMGAATAGAIYTSAEQDMIQKCYDTLRSFGLGS